MMSDVAKSSARSSPKPVNVFYVWYTELCRRINSNPAPVVKPAKPKCDTVLDFVADRLKVEEWSPVLNALRHDTSLHVITIRSRIGNCQFLHDIDTEDKARRMKRRYGSLWTAYILKSLLKSISYSIRHTQVLTCLELEGLPIFDQYLEPLLQALKKNKTIKMLSLSHCSIKDIGCQLVCGYLRYAPNVEVLNLSGCSLSPESGNHIGKLIKFQQINRYCESWHNSLRYENPEAGNMRGIKRITVNYNPTLGDEGSICILQELEDDLWIKAIDMQRCGITEQIAGKIMDVLHYNRSLEIADFRQNDLHINTIDKILTILKEKQNFNFQPEFQWCNTALTIAWDSVRDSRTNISSISNNHNIYKSRSAPLKNITSSKCSGISAAKSIRKSQTSDNVQRKIGVSKVVTNYNINKNIKQKNSQKEVTELNSKLQVEIAKRIESERRNKELEEKLNEIKSVTSFHLQKDQNGNIKSIMDAIEKLKPRNGTRFSMLESSEHSNLQSSTKSDIKPILVNNVKNGYHKNGINPMNGFSKTLTSNAGNIFEKMMAKKALHENSDDEDLISYYTEGADLSHIRKNCDQFVGINDMSSSQVSLFKFMEELKNNNPNLSINFKNKPSTSKYLITEKKT